MTSWLKLFRPSNPTTQSLLTLVDTLDDEAPSLTRLKDLSILHLSLVTSIKQKQPRMYEGAPTFQTLSGTSHHYPFPAFDYIRLLAIAVWKEAVCHALSSRWPHYLGTLDPEHFPNHEPTLSLPETLEWCKNTSVLIETLLKHCRDWVPDLGELSLQSFRHRQAALLAIAQALVLLDPQATSLHGIQESHLILSQCRASLPALEGITEYLRHVWCHDLALAAFDSKEFGLAYWALCELDLTRRQEHYNHQVTEIMQDLETLKREDRIKVFYPASSDLIHVHYRQKYILPTPVLPPDRPVPLQLLDTAKLIVPHEVYAIDFSQNE